MDLFIRIFFRLKSERFSRYLLKYEIDVEDYHGRKTVSIEPKNLYTFLALHGVHGPEDLPTAGEYFTFNARYWYYQNGECGIAII